MSGTIGGEEFHLQFCAGVAAFAAFRTALFRECGGSSGERSFYDDLKRGRLSGVEETPEPSRFLS